MFGVNAKRKEKKSNSKADWKETATFWFHTFSLPPGGRFPKDGLYIEDVCERTVLLQEQSEESGWKNNPENNIQRRRLERQKGETRGA